MIQKTQSCLSLLAGLALGVAAISTVPTARANVYATDIKINGNLTNNPTAAAGNPVAITFVLNEAATAGTTINILSASNAIRTISIASGAAGTLRGSNNVTWDGKTTGGAVASPGAYNFTITAAAVGFTNWTKTSLDSTPGNVAVYPHGIAVDGNTNSPYYGRVFVGNSVAATQHTVAQLCGIYKYNADGSLADEGSFGYGGYTTNDYGTVSTTNSMAAAGLSSTHLNPGNLRVGNDDRIYMADHSYRGAVVSFDMQVSTYIMVINEGPGSIGYPNSTNNYSGNPYVSTFNAGLTEFDITGSGTNMAVWLCQNDFPSWGIWYFHLTTNGVSDPDDTVGTWALAAGSPSDLSLLPSGGCSIDTNLDIFVSQDRANAGDVANRCLLFTNWDAGSLYPDSTTGDEYGQASGQALWAVGSADNTFAEVQDTVIDSRDHPTKVALPMLVNATNPNGGIRVLDAATGLVISVTNGAAVQTLTNLDSPAQYSCAAWDNVGNLYGASTSVNYWRVFSPPGANQATTAAYPVLTLTTPVAVFKISAISVSGGTITISFNADSSLAATAFTLLGSATLGSAASYMPISGAAISSVGTGLFQATVPVSGATEFYRISHQ